MKSFLALPVRDLLDLFTAGEPAPGGGSAAALGAALGVSLLGMVVRLPKARMGAPEVLARRAATAASLQALRERLLVRAEEDEQAYRRIRSAYRLPMATEAEHLARRQAIEAAIRGAIDVPLDMMRACREALGEAVVVAACGIARARGEVAVAIELLTAALRGAGMCVDENVSAAGHAGLVEDVMRERWQLEADAGDDVKRARNILGLSSGDPSRVNATETNS